MSLGVVASAAGVAAGAQVLDPIIGILISAVILKIAGGKIEFDSEVGPAAPAPAATTP